MSTQSADPSPPALPRFSIVTPSYNQARYIGETIDSVLLQAGDFEIEYLVMDGGSTDGSVEVIKAVAGRVTSGDWPVRCAGVTFHWVSQADRGQAHAINAGLRRSTGTILAYLNSDDRYLPGAFARVTSALASHPEADIVFGDGNVIDADGRCQWEWLSRPYDQRVMTAYHFLWNDFSNYVMQQATFWRRRVLDRIGYFDETFHFALDVEYWARAAHAGLHLRHERHKLAEFRLIPGTKSRSTPTAFWPDQLELYRRYRGGRSLTRYFAYYYYNLARQVGFDPERTRAAGEAIASRWTALPHGEQERLSRQAERGFRLACILAAADRHAAGERAAARRLFGRGVTGTPLLVLHPRALCYALRVGLGVRGARLLDRALARAIATYRAVRYDYRYWLRG